MSLKTKASEKVPHPKSYSRLIFWKQLIKYSMFKVSLRTMINTVERALTEPLCLAVMEATSPYANRGCVDPCTFFYKLGPP